MAIRDKIQRLKDKRLKQSISTKAGLGTSASTTTISDRIAKLRKQKKQKKFQKYVDTQGAQGKTKKALRKDFRQDRKEKAAARAENKSPRPKAGSVARRKQKVSTAQAKLDRYKTTAKSLMRSSKGLSQPMKDHAKKSIAVKREKLTNKLERREERLLKAKQAKRS